jgi:hypothetical protein
MDVIIFLNIGQIGRGGRLYPARGTGNSDPVPEPGRIKGKE